MIELGRCKGTAHSIPWVVCTAVPERHSSPALEGRGLLAENGKRLDVRELRPRRQQLDCRLMLASHWTPARAQAAIT